MYNFFIIVTSEAMLNELKKKDFIETIFKLRKIQAESTFHIVSLVEEFKVTSVMWKLI